MGFVVKPARTDLSYRFTFKEPLLKQLREEARISFIGELAKAFSLSLDDIKFNQQALSNDAIHFSRFYDVSWLDVALGLEQIEAVIRGPQDLAQIGDLWGKLYKFFDESMISLQKINIFRQFSTEQDPRFLLESLNPYCPPKFKDLLDGRGVYYILKIPKRELTVYITFVNSLFIPKGLYLGIENTFSPNLYNFQGAFELTKEYYDFIIEELNLTVLEETLK